MIDDFNFRPELFHDSAIENEMRTLTASVNQKLRDAPARWEMSLEVERSLPPGNGTFSLARSDLPLNAEDFHINGPGGQIRIRRIVPSTGAPTVVYLHFHGGGFYLGSAGGQDCMLNELAHDANAIVLSVEYRLAPEHPYPAAVADAEAAAFWLVGNSSSVFGLDRIVLGGESAGAYLSLSAALRLRDRHGFTALAGLNLFQGAFDLRGTPSICLSDNEFVGRRAFETNMKRFVGERRNSPEVSPLFHSLHDLPPALISLGTADACMDDSLFLYMRWLTYARQAVLHVYPGAFHGFLLFDCRLARIAKQKVAEFVRNAGVK